MAFSSSKKLSVIIPVYNTQKYLIRCIESVINQSYKNIELILVDDYSRDNSAHVIKTYCNNHKNVQGIFLEDQHGAGYARAAGFSKASGHYIGFVDSDDWVDSNYYNILISALERNSCEIAMSGIHNEFGGPITSSTRYEYHVENPITGRFALGLLSRTHAQDNYITPIMNNKIYCRRFIEKNDLFYKRKSYNEDDAFTFLSFIYAKKVVLTPRCVYHYYQRSDSITHTFSKQHVDSLVTSFVDIKKRLLFENIFEDYSKEYYSFLDKCINSCLCSLFLSEKKQDIQKKYIMYLIDSLDKMDLSSEYFDYIEIERFKIFFGL